MKTRRWNYAAIGVLVVGLTASTVPWSAMADAVTNAYWTGSGHGYALGATGVGVVGDKGMVSAFYTGSRDGYDSAWRFYPKVVGTVFIIH